MDRNIEQYSFIQHTTACHINAAGVARPFALTEVWRWRQPGWRRRKFSSTGKRRRRVVVDIQCKYYLHGNASVVFGREWVFHIAVCFVSNAAAFVPLGCPCSVNASITGRAAFCIWWRFGRYSFKLAGCFAGKNYLTAATSRFFAASVAAHQSAGLTV